MLGGLALVPAVKRRFGWAYALYVLGVCGMALVGTKDFMGSGRYLLSAFPAIAALGELLSTRRGLRRRRAPAVAGGAARPVDALRSGFVPELNGGSVG